MVPPAVWQSVRLFENSSSGIDGPWKKGRLISRCHCICAIVIRRVDGADRLGHLVLVRERLRERERGGEGERGREIERGGRRETERETGA